MVRTFGAATPRTIRVVVADHHPMVRAGFAALLDATPGISVVGEAADGGEAIHLALATHPDVVVLDVALPVVDGIETVRRLRDAHTSAPPTAPRSLLVTAVLGDDYSYEGVRAGAGGIVPRDARADELVTAVRRAAADDGLVGGDQLLAVVADLTRGAPRDPAVVDAIAKLDETARRLLVALAAGYDDAAIARHFAVPVERVSSAVADVRDRLGAAHRTELVVVAHRAGLASWADAPSR